MLTKKYREEMIANVRSATQDMEADWNKRANENIMLYTSDVDNDADYYFFGLQSTYDLLNPVYSRLNTNGSALEIGCGMGRVLRHTAHIFNSICGVDVSSNTIQLCNALYSQHPHIAFEKINGINLEIFGDDTFDFIYSMYVIDHIPKKEWAVSLIEDIYRVAIPNGIIRLHLAVHDQSTDEGTTWCGAKWTLKEWEGFIKGFGSKYELTSYDEPFNDDRDLPLNQSICWTTIIKNDT